MTKAEFRAVLIVRIEFRDRGCRSGRGETDGNAVMRPGEARLIRGFRTVNFGRVLCPLVVLTSRRQRSASPKMVQWCCFQNGRVHSEPNDADKAAAQALSATRKKSQVVSAGAMTPAPCVASI